MLRFRKSGLAAAAAAVLLGVSFPGTSVKVQAKTIQETVQEMTVEEKAAQLFIVRPEQLTGEAVSTTAGTAMQTALKNIPVGGILYFSGNLVNPDQTRAMLQTTQQMALEETGIPLFLATDEEGGTVARIAGNPAFGVTGNRSMRELAEEAGDDASVIAAAGMTTGTRMKDLGFNLDFAPVADVAVEGAVIGSRSFGTDPNEVARDAWAFAAGLQAAGVAPCYKHFPGYGRAMKNSDLSSVSIDADAADLAGADLVPYVPAVQAGLPFVMVGNMSFPNITGSETPACLSPEIVTGILRNQLGFHGVAVTDAMNAQAITSYANAADAAVLAVNAGCDMLLDPDDFALSYAGILRAVQDGTISMSRLDEAVTRILTAKQTLFGGLE